MSTNLCSRPQCNRHAETTVPNVADPTKNDAVCKRHRAQANQAAAARRVALAGTKSKS